MTQPTPTPEALAELLGKARKMVAFDDELAVKSPGIGRGYAAMLVEDLANAIDRLLASPSPAQGATPAEAGAETIAAERRRQAEREGWTAAHDDAHDLGELATAGAAYAAVASAQQRGAEACEFSATMMISEGEWPFEAAWWRPSDDPIRNLAKAGALIAAEIDRLRRLAALQEPAK